MKILSAKGWFFLRSKFLRVDSGDSICIAVDTAVETRVVHSDVLAFNAPAFFSLSRIFFDRDDLFHFNPICVEQI